MSTLTVNKTKTAVFYAALVLFAILIAFPFFWQIMTSLKSPEQIYLMPPVWIPSPVYWGSYIASFTRHPLLTYLQNSVIVATGTTLLCVFIGSLCSYALARLRFRGKNLILIGVLIVSMFPGVSTLSPLYIFLRDLNLLNTYQGLILSYISHSLPFAIWILISFYRDIPAELEESALIDGTSRFGAFWRVITPLAVPGIFTTAILVFIGAWNEFIFALTFMSNDAMKTVPVGIAMFPGEHDIPWGDISAASVIVTVPLILVVLFLQRRIISGLTAGAVKG